MSDWVTTIITAISQFFTTLYTVNAGNSTNVLDLNPILLCVLLPVVGGVAAFCTRLVKRRKG